MLFHANTMDLEYMRPPEAAFNISHDSNYIKKNEKKKGIRKIFNKVQYDEYERKKIEEFKEVLQKEKVQLPSTWTDLEILKYCYSGRFDFKKCTQNLKDHLEWLNDPNTGGLKANALQLIKDGVVYISARGNGYRPVIIVNVHKIDLKKTAKEDFTEALVFILNTAVKFCYIPYHIENWIIIIETNGAGLTNFPTTLVKQLIQVTQTNYQACLERLYIMNPSFMLKASFDLVKSFMDPDTAGKLFMLRKKDYHELLEKIPIDQVEEKYGGKLKDPTVFWPPYTTLKEAPYTQTQKKAQETTQQSNIPETKPTNDQQGSQPQYQPQNGVQVEETKIEYQNPQPQSTYYYENQQDNKSPEKQVHQPQHQSPDHPYQQLHDEPRESVKNEVVQENISAGNQAQEQEIPTAESKTTQSPEKHTTARQGNEEEQIIGGDLGQVKAAKKKKKASKQEASDEEKAQKRDQGAVLESHQVSTKCCMPSGDKDGKCQIF